MNDTPFTIIGDEPVEARIVAWVLGEASAFEAEELERLCAERPELMVFRRRMRVLHGLLSEAEAAQPDEGWKLPPEKRKALDEVFGTTSAAAADPVVEKRVRSSARRAILSIAACLMLAFGIMFFIPGDRYESEALIEIKPRPSSVSLDGSDPTDRSMQPQIFSTEFEKIKSRDRLEQVAGRLGLEKRWNVDRETAIRRLKSSIHTSNIKGTDLVSIRVSADDPEDAKQIASEVTKSYQAYRNQIETKQEEQALAELNKAVRDQEDKVEERRRLLATITNTKGIVYKGQDTFYNTGGVDEDRGASAALQEYEKLESEKLRLKTQVESLLKYDSDQLAVYAAGLDVPDNVVRNMLPKYQEEERQLQGLRSRGLGENHPEVQDATKKLAVTKSQLEAGVANLRTTLTAQMQMTDAQLKEVETRKDQARESAIKRGLDAQDYVDAKRDFENDQEILQSLKLKKVAAEISGRVPKAAIEIHEDPAKVEPARKSLASSLIGKASSLGSVFGGRGESKAAAEASALASRGLSSEKVASDRVASLPPARGALVARDRVESESADRQVARSSYAAPAKPTSAPAPSPAAPPVASADSSLAFQADMPADVSKPAAAAGGEPATRPTGDAEPTADAFATMDRDGSRSDALAAEGKDSGLGWGGGFSSGSGGPTDKHLASEKFQNGAPAAHLAAIRDAKPGQKQDIQRDELKAARKPEETSDAAMADAKVPILEEVPALGGLFKRTAATVSGVRSGDHPVDGKETDVSLTGKSSDMPLPEMDGFVNFGTPVDDRGRDTRATVARAARPGADQSLPSIAVREISRRGVQGMVPAKPQAAEDVLTEEQSEAVDGDPVRKKLNMAEDNVDLAKLMEEIPAAEDPYSTFSLNVSDASFKIAQAALAKGGRPDPAGVKVEQFYNAVDYGDPAPSGALPVALTAERCAHPVIPGRDLVRVSVKTAAAGRGAAQPLRLTLLVDQSGSMVREDRREAMAKALASLAGLLTANDRVTLIGFSRTPHLLADGLSGDQAGKLPGMVHQEAAEGGTNLEEAIKLAEQLAKRHKLAGAQNRIVLFTDGAANLGDADPANLARRVKDLRQGGFAFDIAGIAADEINDGLLAELARHGNGRYSIIGKGDDGEFAERLAGAFRPAAENVKVQVRFNPERVARYKLIGFEKDRLKTEDFRNDAVDAAEMAAEEAGVAIYQVETIPGGSGELGEVGVRFRDAASGTMVERSMVLGHSGAAPAIDKASPSMQLAVLSMLAAEKLRGGPLGAAVDFNRLAGPRGAVRAFFGPGSRAAEMLQVIDRLD